MQAKDHELNQSLVLNEIIETEKHYNESIQKLIVFLSKPEILDNQTIANYRQCAEQFKLISDKFLSNIDQTKEAINNQNDVERRRLQVERLELVELFFANYTHYYNALKTYQELSREQPVPVILTTLWNQQKNEFDDLIIQPLQRGARYELLVQELSQQNNIADDQKEIINNLLAEIKKQLMPFNSQANAGQSVEMKTILDFLTKAYQYRNNLVHRAFNYQGLLPFGIHRDEKINAVDALCAIINGNRDINLAPFARALQDGRLYRLIKDDLQVIDNSMYRAFTKKLLIDQLMEYRVELENRASEYRGFFKRGYSKTTKLNAVKEMVDALITENGEYPISYRSALNNGRLGQIINQWQQSFGDLPLENAQTSLTK